MRRVLGALLVLISAAASGAQGDYVKLNNGPIATGVTAGPLNSRSDGTVGEWSAWTHERFIGICPEGEEGMERQVRTRPILTLPAYGGTPLPATSETQDAVVPVCPPGLPQILPETLPDPHAGYTTLRMTATAEEAPAGGGAFRIECELSHYAYEDPIVFPGLLQTVDEDDKPVSGPSHLHMFFGNTSTNGASTQTTLAAATAGTCNGGIANMSSYWVPAMINTVTHAPVEAVGLWYYKARGSTVDYEPLANYVPPPTGLRMIAGRASNATGPVTNPGELFHVSWHFECLDNVSGSYGSGQSIPDCDPGDTLELVLDFPSCWDGVNLDSPDHRSHMKAMGRDAGPVPPRLCASSHPVPIPVLTLNVRWLVLPGQDTTTWRLSSDSYTTALPGGYSVHGDAWFNWMPDRAEAFTEGCVKSSRDCHAHLSGDGYAYY